MDQTIEKAILKEASKYLPIANGVRTEQMVGHLQIVKYAGPSGNCTIQYDCIAKKPNSVKINTGRNSVSILFDTSGKQYRVEIVRPKLSQAVIYDANQGVLTNFTSESRMSYETRNMSLAEFQKEYYGPRP